MNRRDEIVQNLESVKQNIKQVTHEQQARLVAVSKYKPTEDIMFAYESGQRHFGENYVQELVEKSQQLPRDIQWHFIGSLQSNKCKTVAAIPNIYVVETVDSIKKAVTLNKACITIDRKDPLRIFVQVNTSEEEVKSGVSCTDVTEVCKYVLENCSRLKLCGLMTIGKFGRDPSEENPDFKCLAELGKLVEKNLDLENLELSMGMSSDYLNAIKTGATNVRVGTTIFGGRQLKTDLKK